MYDLEKLADYVQYATIIYFNHDRLAELSFSNEVIEVLSNKGIPQNVGLDISFKTLDKGGLCELKEVFQELSNYSGKILDLGKFIYLAEHNNTFILKDFNSNKIYNYDYENDIMIYVNQDYESFLKCVLILNKKIFEIRTKFPKDYFADHFDEKILKKIMKEMVDVDSSINRELSFWSFIFEEIEELRE